VAKRAYLSMCTIYRDQAPLLREWIEFHRLVGVERFFLYNNSSQDEHREVLAPYVREGLVVIHDWPVEFPPALVTAFNHCLAEHGDESRWIAFLDLDEYLFSPTLEPLPAVLPAYERHAGVGAVSLQFGTSGHVTQPPGLIIENFLYRWHPPEMSAVKSIVDPTRTERCRNAHWFLHPQGLPVDEQHHPLEEWRSPAPSFEKLQINHYVYMSRETAEEKFQRWATSAKPRPRGWFQRELEKRNDVRDERITAYVPALREAMGLPQEARSQSGR
jgi:hypothetical protein